MERINKRITKIICMCMILIFVASSITMASTTSRVDPTDNQYFELTAVEIKTVEGQNKQVIMELWGYDIEFKRTNCTFFI